MTWTDFGRNLLRKKRNSETKIVTLEKVEKRKECFEIFFKIVHNLISGYISLLSAKMLSSIVNLRIIAILLFLLKNILCSHGQVGNDGKNYGRNTTYNIMREFLG